MILPTLIVGNELLILAGVAAAVGLWFFAHRHGQLRGLVDAAKTAQGVSGRDQRAVFKTVSGMLKLLYPHGQVNDADLLGAAGFANATALVTRMAGTAPFGAYAVFNDNLSNDGSYVPAVASGSGGGTLVVPVVVETSLFESERVLYNPGLVPVVASLTYVESLATPKGATFALVSDAPGELDAGIELVLADGRRLRMRRGVDEQTLRTVLAAVGSGAC